MKKLLLMLFSLLHSQPCILRNGSVREEAEVGVIYDRLMCVSFPWTEQYIGDDTITELLDIYYSGKHAVPEPLRAKLQAKGLEDVPMPALLDVLASSVSRHKDSYLIGPAIFNVGPDSNFNKFQYRGKFSKERAFFIYVNLMEIYYRFEANPDYVDLIYSELLSWVDNGHAKHEGLGKILAKFGFLIPGVGMKPEVKGILKEILLVTDEEIQFNESVISQPPRSRVHY